MECCSIELVWSNADSRNVRARREEDLLHGLGLRVKIPALVGPRDKLSLRVPSSNIGVSVVKLEKQEFLGLASVQGDGMPAASLVDFVLK